MEMGYNIWKMELDYNISNWFTIFEHGTGLQYSKMELGYNILKMELEYNIWNRNWIAILDDGTG